MDLRTKKTRRSIKNAFLQLRASKDIERITVKELADLAEISKATFYLHYHDVYDLSDDLEKEVIQSCLDSIPADGETPDVEICGLKIHIEKIEQRRVITAIIQKQTAEETEE